LFYPTLYEGFGFPVVEAMKSGCPVISSNISAIKEIGQNALILVENPKKKDEFINAIKTLLNDSIRQQYIARGLERAKFFSWEKHFLETKKFYNEVYSKKFNMKLFKEI
jgi:mannosyltransferase